MKIWMLNISSNINNELVLFLFHTKKNKLDSTMIDHIYLNVEVYCTFNVWRGALVCTDRVHHQWTDGRAGTLAIYAGLVQRTSHSVAQP